MTLAHELKPTATVHTANMDGWLRDKEGNRIRRWFTTIGEGGELRVWPPKLEFENLHALEKKRWEGVMKLRAWNDTQEEPMQEKLNALTGPLVGDCPDDYPDELDLKIILRRGSYTNPEARGRWNWYREEDHPPLAECGDGQELVNELWYVIQRRRTIAKMAGAYHTAFTHVLDQRYMRTLTERATDGPLKWKAVRMTINGREYIFKADRTKYSTWIEFVILPEDLDVLVIPEVAK